MKTDEDRRKERHKEPQAGLVQNQGAQLRSGGLLRAWACCAVGAEAPETLWQAGRLPHFQRHKFMQIKELCRWRQPANPLSQLADWQTAWQAGWPLCDRTTPLSNRHEVSAARTAWRSR